MIFLDYHKPVSLALLFFDLLANEELQGEAERLAQEVIKLPVEQQRKIVERWFPAHLELSDV